MVPRLLLICLCLGVLSTVTGCAVAFPSYETSSYKPTVCLSHDAANILSYQ